MARTRKVGRPISSDWKETAIAAAELGLTPDQLLSLRTQIFAAGKHYRCKNPTVAPQGRRYLWHVQRCEILLIPKDEL